MSGVVLSDQVKSVDWRARKAELLGRVDGAVLDAVRENIVLLLGW